MGLRDWFGKAFTPGAQGGGKDLAVKNPITQAQIETAVGSAVRTALSDVKTSGWMNPNQPLLPQQQEIAGRQFDYPVGINLQYTPRGNEGISFAQLRQLADGYDLMRLLIETRKDQLVKFKWQIAPIDDKVKPDDRCKQITNFMRFPDRRNNWQTWLRMLVEELLVIDAPCIYPRLTNGGEVYSLDLMDGATLKRVIDSSGRTPEPPDAAYQQIIKGIPAVDYHADEIIYAPRNVRVNKLYGYSPVEQTIMTVNIALRRQLFTLQYYTEGNIPEALATVPKDWNVDQIKAYQAYWDSLMEGNTAQRRHLKFIPDGTKYYATKDEVLKDAFDEWLARVCCYAFSLPPGPFIRDQNRATSESAKEAALEEGLVPLMTWVKDTIDLVLWKWFDCDDLEFHWEDEEATDPVEQAKIDDINVRNGTASVDEIRQSRGQPSIGMPNAIYGASGATLIKDVLNPPEPPPMMGPDGKPLPGQQPPGKPGKEPSGKPGNPVGGQPPGQGKPASDETDSKGKAKAAA
jgi:hypothetical protein